MKKESFLNGYFLNLINTNKWPKSPENLHERKLEDPGYVQVEFKLNWNIISSHEFRDLSSYTLD